MLVSTRLVAQQKRGGSFDRDQIRDHRSGHFARDAARGYIRGEDTTMGPAWGFRGYENIDSKRLAYNQWIRTVGVTILDRLIDFDAVLNDPNNPSHMLPQYLTDGIHPNNAGHQAMADSIDLNLFK
jgi:hypothetical protein